MSKTINEAHIKGRTGRDAETKFTSTGKSITKLSVATGGGKDKSGKEYPVEWHNVEVWDNESVGSLKKGDEVEIWGRIKTDSWTDKQSGQKKYMSKIVANKVVPIENAESPMPESDRYQYEPSGDPPF